MSSSSATSISSQIPRTDPFSILPDEDVLQIFSYLAADDLNKAACVSHHFKANSSDCSLWKPITEKRFGSRARYVNLLHNNWKRTYQTLAAAEARIDKAFIATQRLINKIQQIANRVFGFTSPSTFTYYIPLSSLSSRINSGYIWCRNGTTGFCVDVLRKIELMTHLPLRKKADIINLARMRFAGHYFFDTHGNSPLHSILR
jgi:hypothetical protein